jgi:hypothetical protein
VECIWSFKKKAFLLIKFYKMFNRDYVICIQTLHKHMYG